MTNQMSLPVRQTASVLALIDAHVRANPLTRGLVICTGALRRCLLKIQERDKRAAQQLMQVELLIEGIHFEDARKQSRVLARLAEIKGLLCALMLTIVIASIFLADMQPARRIARRSRRLDDFELVEVGEV